MMKEGRYEMEIRHGCWVDPQDWKIKFNQKGGVSYHYKVRGGLLWSLYSLIGFFLVCPLSYIYEKNTYTLFKDLLTPFSKALLYILSF